VIIYRANFDGMQLGGIVDGEAAHFIAKLSNFRAERANLTPKLYQPDRQTDDCHQQQRGEERKFRPPALHREDATLIKEFFSAVFCVGALRLE
jgi:hypothetical protein